MTCDIDYRLSVSLCTRVLKEIIEKEKKTMRGKNLK